MTSTTPFDHFATEYDTQFSERLAASWLRSAVYERVAPLLNDETAVVELGCGTGEDALWLARQGCRVWATDASAMMLQQARRKIDALRDAPRPLLQQLDVTAWQPTDLPDNFGPDLIFSNFGALNCVEDLSPVFETARQTLKPGGHFAICLMGRFCLTETIYFGLHGQFRKAARRWNGEGRYLAGDMEHGVWYHTPSTLRRSASGFRQVSLHGIGGLLPPSEGFGLCERWPRTFSVLARCDRRLSRYLTAISDHYLIILQREG